MTAISKYMSLRDERTMVLPEEQYHALLCMDLANREAQASWKL